jgi:CelD/BcsL family acetyltransferase involved in cellulose biosynthesis
MSVQIVDRFEDLLAYREAWNQLAARSATHTVFQTFEWLTSWWQAFGDAYELRAVLVQANGELLAAAPAVASSTRAWGRPLRRLEFAGGVATDYADVLAGDATSLRRVVDVIASDVRWDLLDLDHVPAMSPTPQALARRFPGWRGTLMPFDVAPAYVFGEGHDGTEILAKKSLKRHANGLKRAGAVEVRHLTDAASIEPQLDLFFTQHIGRRATTGAPSHFLNETYRGFYRRLTRALAARGWLLFTVVSLDGRPVAFHYGFVHERRLVWYKPTFAIDLAHLSPGEVLIAELFKYCREHGLAEFDFSVGAEAFKMRFANVTRSTVKFRVFRSRLLQQLDRLERTLRARARRIDVVRRLHARIVRGEP